jgi:hypothetical protein
MGGCADCQAQDDDDLLGEGLIDAAEDGFTVNLLKDNISLLFSQDPFFI